MRPPVLSGSFRTLNPDGEVTRSGFHFKVFLPAPGGFGLSEVDLTTIESSGLPLIDTDLAETTWCAYAWPANAGNSGIHTYFVNQKGDITRSERAANLRSGPNGIEPDEVGFGFEAGGDNRLMTGTVAVGTIGRDGEMWTQVN